MTSTIAALATPPGLSGLAVIRISGVNTFEIIDKCFKGKKSIFDSKSHTIHYGKIIYNDDIIDSVTISIFKSPNSYTGEDVIEIGCHGGFFTSNKILGILYELGCSYPESGEYTKRAFLNGKLDLLQVEAVADIIHSVSQKGTTTAARQLEGNFTFRLDIIREKLIKVAALLELELDFSDEDLEFIDKKLIAKELNETIQFVESLLDSYKGSLILKNGFAVAIVGFPNSGKSTLFNNLVGKSRAIVSEIEGTTRDYLEEFVFINNIPIKFIDTAGLRDTKDIIEIEGIKLVESILKTSNLILVINDASVSINNSDKLFEDIKSKNSNSLLIQNKIDLVEGIEGISAKNNLYIDLLKEEIYKIALESTERVNDILINERHYELLKQIKNALNQSLFALENFTENEIIAIDIRNAISYMGELTGKIWSEDVLNKIFSSFCIGK